MFAPIGRFVVWTVGAIAVEYALRKSGALKAIGDSISEIGKTGTRQEKEKPTAVDNLDLTKEKKAADGD
jgi:hypothetical protein